VPPSDDGLLGAADIRALAAQLDLTPTKTLGQNFVHDANTIRRIVRLSGVNADDHVLEIGPGLGSLTLGLLDVGASVTAVEIDPRLAALLPSTVAERQPAAAARLTVVEADGAAVTDLPDAPTALVANLPYNVGVPILLHLLERFGSLRTALILVQAEVADRLTAAPGSRVYGVPTVKAAWYAEAKRSGSVSRHVFWPVPNVDSGLVLLTRREPPAVAVDRREVFAVIDAAFAQRRKTLRAALAGWAGSAPAAEEILRAAGTDPGARGEQLTVTDFARIAAAGADARRQSAGPGEAIPSEGP
jgi:16S rRNA (adenine1518-N6/adenine1519-N6)-dimethyltransferase